MQSDNPQPTALTASTRIIIIIIGTCPNSLFVDAITVTWHGNKYGTYVYELNSVCIILIYYHLLVPVFIPLILHSSLKVCKFLKLIYKYIVFAKSVFRLCNSACEKWFNA